LIPAISKVTANIILNILFSILINENRIVAKTLPTIEKTLKNNESLILVLFCRKYVINPVKDEKSIMKVLVSLAIKIASTIILKKRISIIETKKTPPPIPAIVETMPDNNPSRINKEMR
jgi:hypothetical protein